MSSPSFKNKKQLEFVLTLGTGTFGSSKNNVVTLKGLRAITQIEKAGGSQMTTLHAKIYGVSQSDMNAITTIQLKPRSFIPNVIDVYAIDGLQRTLVFSGNIINAWGDYQNQPDVFLMVQAQAAYVNQLKAVPPRSFKGAIDVASVMAQIARDMGYTFENNGVDVALSDVYLANTGLEQAKELAKIAGIGLYIDDKVLAIVPDPYSPRKSLIPLVSPETGLVGYPTYDGVGVNFKMLFNPSVTFGGLIKLETSIIQAQGQWIVTSVNYDLTSELPGGAWFAQIRGNENGLAIAKR